MTWHDDMIGKKLSCWVGGQEVHSTADRTSFISPTNGQSKALHLGNQETAQNAIDTAQKSLTSWQRNPASIRAKILRRVAKSLKKNSQLLAETMTWEMGKPICESLGEVEYSAGFFTWFAAECETLGGADIPSSHPQKRLAVRYAPVGVCALITPWNFPLAMPARKLAAALAAGCSVVIKPSLLSPFSAVALARICEEAGVPPGVINIIFGDDEEIGRSLTESSIVRKLSFTGSVPVGVKLYERCAQTMKKLTLELGGHAPFLVFNDADLNLAVKEALIGKFRNNGQTCVCPNRILVQEALYDNFVEDFIAGMKSLKVGDPFDPKTTISHVLHPASKKKMDVHISDAVTQGASLHSHSETPYSPKALVGVTREMKIFNEETFGPLAAISSFSSDEEGISLANTSEYGLAAYIFTRNLQRAYNVSETLEYGIVGINDGVPSAPQASFGGIKQSGLGREGGPSGIYEYLTERFVSLAL